MMLNYQEEQQLNPEKKQTPFRMAVVVSFTSSKAVVKFDGEENNSGKAYKRIYGNTITVVNTETKESIPYKLSSKYFFDSHIMADFVTNNKIVCVYSAMQAFVPNSVICVIDLKEEKFKTIKALKNVLISDFC